MTTVMQRLSTAGSCLLGAVVAHAVTGWVVHVLHLGGNQPSHRVHVPLAVAAATLAVANVVWRGQGSRSGETLGSLGARFLLLSGYLFVEAGLIEGFGSHLLHDPWLLLTAVGVLLAHLGTSAMGTAIRTLLVGLIKNGPCPVGTARRTKVPHNRRWVRHNLSSGLLSRGPPLRLGA